MVAKELNRLQSDPIQLEQFMKSNVSRLLKSNILAVLAEFQRQYLIFLSMKGYASDVCKEQKARWSKKVWEYLKREDRTIEVEDVEDDDRAIEVEDVEDSSIVL
nr:pentatricopeptide repeat-containing protein At1g62350-like [Ipomoea trifida]